MKRSRAAALAMAAALQPGRAAADPPATAGSAGPATPGVTIDL